MVLHNPNNFYHVSIDAERWARSYFEQELVGTSAEGDGVSAKVEKVMTVDGDCEVSQRKGKLMTLFDLKLQLEYGGKTKDDDDVNGTITIPEVAHDTAEDEYVFDIEIYGESSSKRPVKDLVRNKITPLLRKKLAAFGPALVSAHAAKLKHDSGSNPQYTAPRYTSNSKDTSVPKQAGDPSSNSSIYTSTTSKARVNVTTLTATDEFRTSADQLYATFTDPQRLAAFTRAPPKVFEGAREGAQFELFGGNIAGKFVEMNEPTRIVQEWRLKQWPEGHFSRLTLRFEQNNVDAVTVMKVDWAGVPVGQEEVTKKNWGEYYVRSIKTTFGFGTIL